MADETWSRAKQKRVMFFMATVYTTVSPAGFLTNSFIAFSFYFCFLAAALRMASTGSASSSLISTLERTLSSKKNRSLMIVFTILELICHVITSLLMFMYQCKVLGILILSSKNDVTLPWASFAITSTANSKECDA
ncbi:hypothetical protein MPTK1_1g08540 [Marchantia polymorpha subsp. ruderalis]|uniref:Uncharacterized protein n=2 Tax=Marchantia polymorpha TaxID=3197 RepID=A0AAF6AMZ2_MARPO|nr:hypothetical protein MARPO_0036s0097 [Marchantia polymorpha]BBM97812.1 hypothetical protein Mp_1g08540 [Marchantia polymorpha subsp. ruderalis]|eukprot:PTQ41115.1 hypothetical protein MARPO_0036s0097 [Marchantia polymorpha]